MDQESQIKVTFTNTGHFFTIPQPPQNLPEGWTFSNRQEYRPTIRGRSNIDHIATFSGPYATFSTADLIIRRWASGIRPQYELEIRTPQRRREIRDYDIPNTNNTLDVPMNATNAILFEPIENGTRMVNFHNEKSFGRYYTRNAYNALPRPKRNPQTRQIIKRTNVHPYRARVVGGRRKVTKRYRAKK